MYARHEVPRLSKDVHPLEGTDDVWREGALDVSPGREDEIAQETEEGVGLLCWCVGIGRVEEVDEVGDQLGLGGDLACSCVYAEGPRSIHDEDVGAVRTVMYVVSDTQQPTTAQILPLAPDPTHQSIPNPTPSPADTRKQLQLDRRT